MEADSETPQAVASDRDLADLALKFKRGTKTRAWAKEACGNTD